MVGKVVWQNEGSAGYFLAGVRFEAGFLGLLDLGIVLICSCPILWQRRHLLILSLILGGLHAG